MCKRLMCAVLAMTLVWSLLGAVSFEVKADTEDTASSEAATQPPEATEQTSEQTDPAETEPNTEPSDDAQPVTEPTEPDEPEETGLKLSLEGEQLLKKYEGFSKYPYWDYSQWSVGYGTSYDMANHERYMKEGISREEADALLWGHIHSKSDHIIKMAKTAGLTLTQNQFDALVLFTYNVGIGWMYSADSEILEAVINGASDNEFIYAMVLWSKADRVTSNGLINRRLAEANIYLNGVYSRTPPADYNFVRFEANGGSVDYTVQGYDMDQPAPIYVKIQPTYQDSDGNVYNFVGWFTDPHGGVQVTALDSSLGYGAYLYAHWDYSHNEPVPDDSEDVIPADGIWGTVMDIGSLNIRSGAGTNYPIVGSYRGGARVLILEQKKVGATYWGRTDKGWISLDYVELDEQPDTPTEPPVTEPPVTQPPVTEPPVTQPPVTEPPVTQPPVTEPPVTQPPVTEPPVTEPPVTEPPVTEPPVTEPPVTEPPVTEPPVTQPPVTEPPVTQPPVDAQWGTIVVDPRLRIRAGAGTNHKVVGYYYNGDRVAILETTDVSGQLWGRTDRGWISMEYVLLDSQSAPEPTDPPATQPPETQPPVTEPPATQPPVTQPPATEPPATQPPVTQPPVTEPPATNPPATEPPATEPPATQPPTDAPTEPSVDSNPTGPWTGEVITAERLRIHSGAGSSYKIIGYLRDGDSVVVTEKKTVGTNVWGKIEEGWICLDNVYLDGNDDFFEGTSMTVAVCSLRLREVAGVGNAVINYLSFGARVQILDQITVDNIRWALTEFGWVNLKYLN